MWNEVIERHPGISGSVFSSYVSLRARLPEITLSDVLDSFEETAELIRVPAMRNALMVFTPGESTSGCTPLSDLICG